MSYQNAQPGYEGIVPDNPVMRKRTYAASLSYVGITRRTTAWVRRVGSNSASTIAAVIAAIFFLLVMYVFLIFWYFIIFFCFGILTIPYRIVRRSHRKQEHVQKQQLATMQAMLLQQQAAMRSGGYPPPMHGGNEPHRPLPTYGPPSIPAADAEPRAISPTADAEPPAIYPTAEPQNRLPPPEQRT